ncbi:hypothetical protein BGZ82_005571 [Podila clonocystis]|nr:hypothetical protein BGZ82_005571 [Podila clonocystis]
MAFRSITRASSSLHLQFLIVGAIIIYIFTRLFTVADVILSHHSRFEYRFTNPSAIPVPGNQTVLILTLVQNSKSWGHGRSFLDFMSIVQGFDYPMSNINLGVLASDEKEFEAIVEYIKQLPSDKKNFFPHIRVILREKDTGVSREGRKDDNAQRDRRRLIARMRNYLLYSTLRDEDSVLWIDSDMVRVPNDLLRRMVDAGKDIITTATSELDSVGGTVLFVRGEVHREGVAFTTNYVIGAGWKHEGYDGIESEGLCYVAGFLYYKCWGMPHAITEHSED